MRTKLRSRISLLFMSFALVLALPAMALADDLGNVLDDNALDSQYEQMALETGGKTKETLIYVFATSQDAGSGNCNFTDNEPSPTGTDKATVTVKSNAPSVATAKWKANNSTSINFTGCGKADGRTLVVTSGSAASETSQTDSILPAEITFDSVNAFGDGTLQMNTARFRVATSNPANTPPSVSVTGVQAGASYEKGSEPAAGCSVTDTEDANESATPVFDRSGLDGNGLGPVQVQCSYTDGGNLTETASATYNIVDTTAPVIAAHDDVTAEATDANGAVVNYTSPGTTDAVYGDGTATCLPASGSQFALGSTTVTCNATDGSGNAAVATTFNVIVKDTTAPTLTVPSSTVVVEATGPTGAVATYQVTAKDAVSTPSTSCTPDTGTVFVLGTTQVTCTATDKAGNTSAAQSFDVKVQDTTAPAIVAHADVTEEATGPDGALVSYTSPGTTDAVDGNGTATCLPASGSQFALGSTTVTCNATDKAGNAAVATTFTVKVQDTIAPNNIQFVGNISDGDSFFFGDTPAQPTCSAADSGSGLQSCVVTGYKTTVGTHTLTATATDKVGNTATKTLSYTVKPYSFSGFYQPVDMNGVYNTVKGGSTVPLKFELFKGATELTDTTGITLQATKVTCASGATIDDIEVVATGGTSLRYDSTGGQYIYNWKTPTGAGTCYKVTVTASDGSTTLSAFFKLK